MDISGNFLKVQRSIRNAASKCGRNENDVKLIAVTKTFSADIVNEAIRCGITDIGENRVQESEVKKPDVTGEARWHLIGHLQKNKAKKAVKIFNVIHSVDSVELAAEINKRTEKRIDILAQINVGGEEQKSGMMPEGIFGFIESIRKMENLNLTGLMTIPPFTDIAEDSREYFKELKNLLDKVNNRNLTDNPLTDLSMGMTNDYETAIEEGATMVRVGRAIFGERKLKIQANV